MKPLAEDAARYTIDIGSVHKGDVAIVHIVRRTGSNQQRRELISQATQ